MAAGGEGAQACAMGHGQDKASTYAI
jgi:hypothetical protein